jgi:transposase
VAYIVGKKQGGQTFYHLVENGRVDGKPRIVSQKYLGKAEDIDAALSGAMGVPDDTRHRGFGDLAAVWQILSRLGVAGIVDDVVGPVSIGTGVSVGTYVALVIANRVVEPTSKLGFEKWWAQTSGERFTKVSATVLDHRRIWDAMDAIDEAQIIEIEARVSSAAIKTFGLDLSGLALDMTNFATFIDSANERNTIAQRGHAKQKRNDLRLVGLGLVVTRDGDIPICSHVYPGNRNDVSQFGDVIAELGERYGQLAQDQELTVVYDAGQGSADNQATIEATGIGFISSVAPSDHPELLTVPLADYHVPDATAFPGVVAYETNAVVFGKQRRVVITHSDGLHHKQSQSFDHTTIAKATSQLSELAARLERGKTRRQLPAVEAEISTILSPRWLNRVIDWNLTGDDPKTFRLQFSVNAKKKAELETELFGKRVLFTDRENWSIADVIAGYRSQSGIESGFRQMKDPKVVSAGPMFHWTDHKVRVHMLTCVLALTTAHLMRREAKQAGIDVSVRELLGTLNGIQETVFVYRGEKGRPRLRHQITEMDKDQRKLFELFELNELAPKG